MSEATLLREEDGPAAAVENTAGRSPIVLVCEHASNRIPAALRCLRLDAAVLRSHVAWDIGALAVARAMSAALDATLVRQRFSRLVYDCNRPPRSADAMPALSETYEIPANRDLAEGERAQRIAEIYEPFHAAIAAAIEGKLADGIEPVLVTIHSFTRIYHGKRRSVDLGILHDSDARLAERLLAEALHFKDCAVRRNEPYGPEDGVTHTLRLHALPRGLENVMFEIANDRIGDAAGQALWATRLSEMLREATAGRRTDSADGASDGRSEAQCPAD
ncbi:MAG TPA: N-formylglutamate amidohydrolase [Pararhizobium sp.]|nr:N-formylglutamate amidohydrolase [Pararhizobium sp.]